jgi:hypothetical protein
MFCLVGELDPPAASLEFGHGSPQAQPAARRGWRANRVRSSLVVYHGSVGPLRIRPAVRRSSVLSMQSAAWCAVCAQCCAVRVLPQLSAPARSRSVRFLSVTVVLCSSLLAHRVKTDKFDLWLQVSADCNGLHNTNKHAIVSSAFSTFGRQTNAHRSDTLREAVVSSAQLSKHYGILRLVRERTAQWCMRFGWRASACSAAARLQGPCRHGALERDED